MYPLRDTRLLKTLTLEQKAVVNHETGHALVKAVPGSGKTTTLVKRVERLVKSGVDPRSILILMYNKAAQVSFSDKLRVMLNRQDVPDVRTFHSLALKIVGYGQRQGLIQHRELLTPGDGRYSELVKRAYRFGFEHETDYIEPSEIEDFELFISRCRAEGVSPADAKLDPTFRETKPELVRAYGEYCDLLESNRLRTFDDCLTEATALLQDQPGLGSHVKHIIVDEYQDVNLTQHRMVRFLATTDTSVMAVGDVNQCIYEWRGARPDFIGGLFESHYPKTRIYHLSCTFRFGHHLSLMANSVIRRNEAKLAQLCVSHPSTPRTQVKIHLGKPVFQLLPSFSTLAGSKAVLSRTRAHLAEVELSLRLAGLPFQYLNSGSAALHTRPEVGMLVVGVLFAVYGDLGLLANNRHKQSMLYGFLREGGFRWRKGQLKEALRLMMAAQANHLSALEAVLDDTPHQSHMLEQLNSILQQDNEQSPASQVFNRLRMAGLISGIGTEGVSRVGANDLKRGAATIESMLIASAIDSRTFLNHILQDPIPVDDSTPFILGTLHGSKGLEWDNVIIVGLNEEDFPGGQPDAVLRADKASQDEIEEERRLFYVGITRGKRSLHLVTPDDDRLQKWLRNRWDSPTKKPSKATRFLYEAGYSACAITSDAIYNNETEFRQSELSKFHQWYLKDYSRLAV